MNLMKWLKENWISLLLTLITALISGLASLWYAQWSGRIKYLEYQAYQTQNILKDIKEMGDSINFSINSVPVENLYALDIAIFNNSDADFEDVDLFIDLSNENDEPFRIYSTTYSDQFGSNEQSSTTSLFKQQSTGIRMNYKVKIINRQADNEPVFKVKYLIGGKGIPKFRVKVAEPGLDLKSLVIESSERRDQLILNILIVTVALTVVLLFAVYRSSTRRVKINKLLLEHVDEIKKRNIELEEKVKQANSKT